MISKNCAALPVFLVALIICAVFTHTCKAQTRVAPSSQQQIQLSFAPLVKQIAPAVVNIYTSRLVTQRSYHPFMNDPFFGHFFDRRGFGGRMKKRVENSLGSGVIVQEEGLVVTNFHVIDGADEIRVVLSDGREYEAQLALADEPSDLALLRVDPEGKALPFAPLKPSESLEVGDIVLAIGNPFGVGQTVTSGIVSAQGRSALDINDFNFFIQTDAAINPGNSGGPLVALDGGVVGINTAIFSRDGGSLGIGFAVPSEMVTGLIAAAEMGRSGEDGVLRPWLGVTAQSLTNDIADSLGLDRPTGALIAELHPASPLKKAGLKSGDIIISINGKPIKDEAEMRFRTSTVAIGERAIFEVARGRQIFTKKVKSIAAPEDPPRDEQILHGPHPLSGATVSNINPAVIIELDLKHNDAGIVISHLTSTSPANRLVRAGDILREVNEREIEDMKDLDKILSKGPTRQGWIFVIERNGQLRKIVLR